MGIREYFDLMLGGGLTVADHGDGTFTLTNAKGAEADVDTVKGIVIMEDMPSFDNYLEDAKAGVQSSFKDSPAPYLRLGSRFTVTKRMSGFPSRSFQAGLRI